VTSSAASPPVLRLNDLRVDRSGNRILNGLGLVVQAADRVVIEGSIGAGKSSLLWAIIGLIESSAGTIEILGRRCRAEADFAPLRGRVALLFQDPDEQLIGPTVLEDVQFGPLNRGVDEVSALRRAHTALSQLGIDDLANRSVRSLSGGQKRLVALAGLLSMDPELWLLDEPTTGLDAVAAQLVIRTLAESQRPMVLVSHDTECIKALATRRCRLQAGLLVEL
jgi:cobalt/nickel transport system ATP-binding protein